MSTTSSAAEIPASAQMMNLIVGKWVSRAISAAADLGIADELAHGPRSTAALGAACGAHELSLYRLLRALASVGVFAETEPRVFALTALAEPLRSDAPGSVRNMARFSGMPMAWRAWEPLTASVRTGESGMKHIGIPNPFEYLEQHPDESAIFNAAMTDISRQTAPAVVEAYDFSRFRTLVDVGGGYGMLLTAVLERYLDLRGILVDLPHVLESARAAGVHERCDTAACDILETVPQGADGYMMQHILHDWDDERAGTILRNCRRAIDPAGLLLVLEAVIPPGNGSELGKLLDLEILAITPGRERTEAEFRELFVVAGFEVTRVIPTRSLVSIVEGRPV